MRNNPLPENLPQGLSLTKDSLEKTAGSLKALAHPVRLAIVDLLRKDNALSVTEIYESLSLEQAVASQHLSILREHNILEARRRGKHTLYQLKKTCVLEVISLMLTTHQEIGEPLSQ